MTSGYPDNPGPYPYGQEPYPPGEYGYGPPAGYGYGPPPSPRRGAGMATAALVLGILALIFFWTIIGGIVLGLVAVVLGAIAFRRARRGEAAGGGRALAGLITGVLGILFAAGLLAFGVSIYNSPSVQNLQSCLQNANGDQAAIQQCEQQFRNQTGR